jgi:hypothetical protein
MDDPHGGSHAAGLFFGRIEFVEDGAGDLLG